MPQDLLTGPPTVPLTDEERIAAKIAEVAATADQYPAVVIIHHVPT